MLGLPRGKVHVLPYQLPWQAHFAEEAARLRAVLGDQAIAIEHIGSTAIEGTDAKPIIDLMVAVSSLAQARGLVPLVEGLGYEYRGDGGVPDRLFFAKGPASKRTHHLSLVESTSAFWKEHLLFRDYLRAHPEAADAYSRLKRALAAQHPENRGAYTAEKAAFVQSILAVAKTGS